MSEFRWPVRVYCQDTDAGGVVHCANFLRFVERARTGEIQIVCVAAEILRPARIPKEIVVELDR